MRRTVVFVTHSVFESVYPLEPHRRDDAAAGPHLHRDCDRRALSAQRKLPHLREYAGTCRKVSDALQAMAEEMRHETPHNDVEMRDRSASSSSACDAGARHSGLGPRGADQQFPPYVLPSPGLVFETLIADWPLLWSSLLVDTRRPHSKDAAGACRRCRACGPVQPVAPGRIFALSLRGDPAGDAGGRDRAAAADLSAAAGRGARLRLDRRVLSGAGEHDARPEFRRPQSRGLFRLYGASRCRCCAN